jgi:hypothetical protein
MPLFVDDARDLVRGRHSIGGLIVPAVVRGTFSLPLHFLVAIVGLPYPPALFLIVFAGDRHNDHVFVFIVCQREPPMGPRLD